MKRFPSLLLFTAGISLSSISAQAAVLVGFDFNDAIDDNLAPHGPLSTDSALLDGGNANSFTDSNLVTVTLSPGTGLKAIEPYTGQNYGLNALNGETANGSATEAAAVTNGLYLEFTLDPKPGFAFSLDATNSLQFRIFTWQKPNGIFVRSSLDGYATTLDSLSPLAAGGGSSNVDVTMDLGSSFTNIDTAVTFRIYQFAGDGNWDTLIVRNDGDFVDGLDFVVNGSTSPIPEPSTYALFGSMLAFVVTVWRRRRGRQVV